jgi:hypothetical protein
MIFGIGYVYLLMPETRSIPLEKMDDLFRIPAWRAHATILAEGRGESNRTGQLDDVDGIESASSTGGEQDMKASEDLKEMGVAGRL